MRKTFFAVMFTLVILAAMLMQTAPASANVVPPAPDTAVSITASEDTVFPGGSVTLTVSETNTGNVDLTNITVVVTGGATFTLTKAGDNNPPGTTFSGDLNSDGKLGAMPAETWTWTIPNVIVNATTDFTATGHGDFTHLAITPDGTRSLVTEDITAKPDPLNPAETLYPAEQQTCTVTAPIQFYMTAYIQFYNIYQ